VLPVGFLYNRGMYKEYRYTALTYELEHDCEFYMYCINHDVFKEVLEIKNQELKKAGEPGMVFGCLPKDDKWNSKTPTLTCGVDYFMWPRPLIMTKQAYYTPEHTHYIQTTKSTPHWGLPADLAGYSMRVDGLLPFLPSKNHMK